MPLELSISKENHRCIDEPNCPGEIGDANVHGSGRRSARGFNDFFAQTLHRDDFDVGRAVDLYGNVIVANPDFMFNNIVHEDTLADFLVHLAEHTRTPYTAVPVGST